MLVGCAILRLTNKAETLLTVMLQFWQEYQMLLISLHLEMNGLVDAFEDRIGLIFICLRRDWCSSSSGKLGGFLFTHTHIHRSCLLASGTSNAMIIHQTAALPSQYFQAFLNFEKGGVGSSPPREGQVWWGMHSV